MRWHCNSILTNKRRQTPSAYFATELPRKQVNKKKHFEIRFVMVKEQSLHQLLSNLKLRCAIYIAVLNCTFRRNFKLLSKNSKFFFYSISDFSIGPSNFTYLLYTPIWEIIADLCCYATVLRS